MVPVCCTFTIIAETRRFTWRVSRPYGIRWMLRCSATHGTTPTLSPYNIYAAKTSESSNVHGRDRASLSHHWLSTTVASRSLLVLAPVCQPSVGVQPATFEYVATSIATGTSSRVAVVVYRPGFTPVTTAFFTELADLLDRLSTTADALVLAGDVNIRLERTSDPAATEFCDLIVGYGLTQHVTSSRHDAGGTLDVVCTRTDLPTPTVNIVDPGLSDHRLLLWTTSLQRPPPVYSRSTRRVWRLFSLNDFQSDLQSSAICDA